MHPRKPHRSERFLASRLWLVLQALTALPVAAAEAPGAAEPGPPDGVRYESALAMAHAAVTPQQLEAAIRALAEVLPRYPQDVEGPLQLGWLEFRAGRYDDAAAHYRLAIARSQPGGDAELGLAWSLLRLGRCDQARPHFRSVAAQRPHSNAADGLRACAEAASAPVAAGGTAGPGLWLQPQLVQSLYLYQQNPSLSRALATTARLDVLWRGRFYGGATYRYSYFGAAARTPRAFSQHDLYLAAGLTTRSAGATLHYAFLTDTSSGTSGPSHHVGLAARYTRYVDLVLSNAASFYRDDTIWRGELAVRVPIWRGLSVRPAGALQWAAGQLWKTGLLTALYDHRRFSLWLGGKYGEELRPAYFGVAYVYNLAARIPYGVWAGAAVRPGAGLTLSLSYAHDRMVSTHSTWTATASPSADVMPMPMPMSNTTSAATASEFVFHAFVLSLAKEL